MEIATSHDSVGRGRTHGQRRPATFDAGAAPPVPRPCFIVQNRVENVGKGTKEGRTLKGYFSHVVKCAIFYAPPTL